VGLCVGIRETGMLVPQMFDGGTVGTIEMVGVSLDPSVIECGTDDCQSTIPGGSDDILVEWTADTDTYRAISWGPDRTLQTTAATGDEERYGYVRAPDGGIIPIPVVDLPVDLFFLPVEVDLSNGDVTYNGTTYDGGIVTLTTGEPSTLADAPDLRGTLESLLITNSSADTETDIAVFIDQLQFEAPEFDPIVAPLIQAPIVQDDTTVTVGGLVPYVNRVKLFKNGLEVGDQALSPATPGAIKEHTFPVPAHVTGDIYTAEQYDSKTPTNQQSDLSPPVAVLSGPPPFSFSILLDEDGNGCSYSELNGGWEWVGVSSVSGWVPQGTGLTPDSSAWQFIDIPLDNDDVVLAHYGGNGQIIRPSTTGFYSIDTIWFTISPEADTNGLGPWEVFVDRVEAIGSDGQPFDIILDMEDGENRLQRQRGQSSTAPTVSALSTTTAYDGTTSHRFLWTYPSDAATETLGMLQRIGYDCTTSELIDDDAVAIRFHLYCRAQATAPGVPIPEVVGPIVVGTQDTVRVNIDSAATSVQLYRNGDPFGSPIGTSGASSVDVPVPGMAVYDSISATQTIGADVSDPAYPRVPSDAVNPPTLTSPIVPGSASVTVNGVYDVAHATASVVDVYVNGSPAGSAPGAEGSPSIVVATGALSAGQIITATQTVNGITSPLSEPVTVGFPPPVIYMAPAEGATSVRVMELVSGVATVTVATTDDVKTFTAPVPPGADRVDVPVSGLVAGDVIDAVQTFGGIDSDPSATETVTTNVTTSILDPAQTFENYADQVAMETFWSQGNAPNNVLLATDQNATFPTGQKSAYGPATNAYMTRVFPDVTATATEPVVVNANIYDPAGVDPGGTTVNWVELNALGSDSDYFFMHIGILGWSDTDNVHYDLRVLGNGGPNWVDLDEYEAPDRSVGWHTFTFVHKGRFVDAYVDGLLSKKNIPFSADTTYSRADIGGGYAQTGTRGVWFDDFYVETGPVRFIEIAPQAPLPPVLGSPIVAGDKMVTITGVVSDATNVTVWDGLTPPTAIGSVTGNPVSTSGAVNVPLIRPLVHLERIHATQANTIGTSIDSEELEVGQGNGDILLTLCIRETGDTGPLGTEGGTTGGFEWIGAATTSGGGAPQGKPISPSAGWQTVTFDPASDPILNFFQGDGQITESRGILEHLAVSVDAAASGRSTGPYRLYVDNVVNVGADVGGGDFVITDFETHLGTPLAVGDEALFNEPRFSGTTDANLLPTPNVSLVSDARGNPDQSERLSWFWIDTTDDRWVRLTSSGAQNVSRPIIDLTKPIQLDVLLLPSCSTALGDMTGNGSIDAADIALFVNCLDGPLVAADPSCVCADFDFDDYVDVLDFAEFQAAFAQ
jgi:hypothetical protein